MSHEGGILEDCNNEAPSKIYEFTKNPKFACDEEEIISITFEKGIPIAINGQLINSVSLLQTLNKMGKKHGIGCLDIVKTV